MTKLIIATRNAHKVGEIQSILGNGFDCQSLDGFEDVPNPVEDGENFGANAAIKARTIGEWMIANHGDRFEPASSWVLADDSGLEVDALNGAPGVHSARFAAVDTGAEGNSSDADNNAKLLRLLAGVEDERRTGRFRCTLALIPMTGGNPEFFDGACEGRLQREASGAGGFGYDPLFVPEGYDTSFAELGEDTKNKLSHRARAVEKLKAFFEKG